MGIFNKLKNTFFEEEVVEIEEPVIEKKIVEKEKIKEEIPKVEEKHNDILIDEELLKEDMEVFTEKKLSTRQSNFKYFEDEDFITTDIKVVEEKKEVSAPNSHLYTGSLYNNQTKIKTPYDKENAVTFKPTPIISPIYGILNSNYHKEDLKDKQVKASRTYVSRKNVDLDSVREKAYGEVSSDLGLGKSYEEKMIDLENDFEEEDNLLYDMTDVDTKPQVDKVTIADAEEYFQDLGLEYNVDYRDVKHEKASGRRVKKSVEIDDIEEVKKDEENEEDNLFDLIESMYNERDD